MTKQNQVAEPKLGDGKRSKRRVALILPEDVRDDPESPFLELFRDNARILRERFRFLCTSGTAAALARTCFFHVGRNIESVRRRGSQGGIIQIANEVVIGRCNAVVFLYDPETLHSESPETRALARQCINRHVPLLNSVEAAAYWLLEDYAAQIVKKGPKAAPLPDLGLKQHKGSIRFAPCLDNCTIALIAHDKQKEAMREFVTMYYDPFFSKFGRILMTESTGFQVVGALHASGRAIPPNHRGILESGPKGGDIRIATEVIQGHCQCVVFFQDPMSSHPHEADISLLRRACQTPESACVLLSDKDSAHRWVQGRLKALRDGRVTSPSPSDAELFRSRHRLKEVIVIDSPAIAEIHRLYSDLLQSDGKDKDGWFRGDQAEKHDRIITNGAVEAAKFAAHYIEGYLKSLRPNARSIAVMHGQTVSRLIQELARRPVRLEQVHVRPGCGNLGLKKNEAAELSGELSKALDMQIGARAVPGLRSGETSADSLPTMVLASVMPMPPTEAKLEGLRPIRDAHAGLKDACANALRASAVGLFGGAFVDARGSLIVTAPQIGESLTYAELKEVPKRDDGRSILVCAFDMRRDLAAAAVISAKLINVLITDIQSLGRIEVALNGISPINHNREKGRIYNVERIG